MSRKSRCEVLFVAVADGAAATFFMAVSLARAASVNDQVQVAVIGVRGKGHEHVRTLGTRRDVRIVTICDVDEKMGALSRSTVDSSSGNESPVVEDFRLVLDDKSVKAVVVVTPHHWHGCITC